MTGIEPLKLCGARIVTAVGIMPVSNPLTVTATRAVRKNFQTKNEC